MPASLSNPCTRRVLKTPAPGFYVISDGKLEGWTPQDMRLRRNRIDDPSVHRERRLVSIAGGGMPLKGLGPWDGCMPRKAAHPRYLQL